MEHPQVCMTLLMSVPMDKIVHSVLTELTCTGFVVLRINTFLEGYNVLHKYSKVAIL